MKKRYFYTILIGVPGLVASLVISVAVVGVAAGALWIFVFGDNPWPTWSESLLVILFAGVFLVSWLALLAVGFAIGKRLESNPALNKRHVMASAAVTILFIVAIGAYELSVGNLGPKTDALRCSEYCSQKGYFGSSLSSDAPADATCNCLDSSGQAIVTVPLITIKGGK